jgi:CRISPR/Cas system CSM-associated protein Csm3 (group 7 of RAMP superfamily)
MVTITYNIQFYAEWHCGSGLSKGADVDALVIRNALDLPYIPGKTLKGLLREAAETLAVLGHADPSHVEELFGTRTESGATTLQPGCAVFSNAELSTMFQQAIDQQGPTAVSHLFRQHASTAIDKDGQAKDHSLRRIETVIPMTLYATVAHIPEALVPLLEQCLQFTKRIGVHRNRGLGRCDLALCSQEVSNG